MHQLQPNEYHRLWPAFEDLDPLHGSIGAVLLGHAEGQAWVDDHTDPSAVLLFGPEGLYLGGRPRPDADYGELRAAIPDWAYLYPSAAWRERLEVALPHPFFLRHERVYLTARPVAARPPALDDGLSLRSATDGSLGCEIYEGDAVVARCVEDLRIGDRIEIGVWTRPDRRRRGLAQAVVAASLNRAAASGIARVGWHCLESNRGSLAVAQRAGFVLERCYSAWSARLPAENAGDLNPATCRAHAEQLAAGVADLAWLGYHAAEAWAQAGELERALLAIEALVAGNWAGHADWLRDSWALAPLAGHPRFVAALTLQAGK